MSSIFSFVIINPYSQAVGPSIGSLSYPATNYPDCIEESAEEQRIRNLRMNAQVLTINANQKIISRDPVIMKCPHCNQTGVTSVKKQNGVLVYLSAVICCVVGMGPCALVPCCIKDLKDCVHYCNYCGNVVATVRRHENI